MGRIWHCSGLVLALVLYSVLYTVLAWPALAWPALALSNTPVYALVQPGAVRVIQVHPGPTTPGHHPHLPVSHPRWLHARQYVHGVKRCRGAHSWLHPWTDCVSSSPAPLPWPILPADRHPRVATLRHPGQCQNSQNSQDSTNQAALVVSRLVLILILTLV